MDRTAAPDLGGLWGVVVFGAGRGAVAVPGRMQACGSVLLQYMRARTDGCQLSCRVCMIEDRCPSQAAS